MKLVSVGEEVTVRLTSEECQIISQGCKDGSTSDNMSISGELAMHFSALAHVAQINGEPTR